MKHELEHTEQPVSCGDVIRLQFPEQQFADVTVLLATGERLLISEGRAVLEFVRIRVPFDLERTVLGDVCGELKLWQSTAFPNSSPAMIVANLGRHQSRPS